MSERREQPHAAQASPALCVNRLGVAAIARRAFEGDDLQLLWDALLPLATKDAYGAGVSMDLAVIAQFRGERPAGIALQKEALDRQRLFRSPCASPSPVLRVLALAAETEVGGNAPIEFLLEGSDVELCTLYIMPGVALPDPLPLHDVAIVVAPHEAGEALAAIDSAVQCWPSPLLNRPASIRALARDRLWQVLHGITGLEIPRTRRLSRQELAKLSEAKSVEILEDGGFPLIARPTLSHAGFGLAKLEAPADIPAYLSERPEEEFFIARFVDYRSKDGLFRKYRLVCIDGAPYACHLALSDEWKLWYLNAAMEASAAKRAEEERFMAGFDAGFAARHKRALAEIASRIGLEYFQIDCAETAAGNLLIFEADSTAIVHNMDSSATFPYKPPQMRKVFDAFVRMLTDHRQNSASD